MGRVRKVNALWVSIFCAISDLSFKILLVCWARIVHYTRLEFQFFYWPIPFNYIQNYSIKIVIWSFFCSLTSHHNRVIAQCSWLVLDLTLHLITRVIAHYSWLVLDFVLTLHLTTTELLPIIAGLSLTLSWPYISSQQSYCPL
jgi:hypothetical protein